MSRLPFEKALTYLVAVKAKFNGDQFMPLAERYFRGIVFDEPPISHVLERLSTMVVPKGVLVGKYDYKSLASFLKKLELVDLHERFHTPVFENLLYSPDIRLKLDVMSMCGFRKSDICIEARFLDEALSEDDVMLYLDTFANFEGMDYRAKRNFIHLYIDSSIDTSLYLKCLENNSFDYIRALLGLRQRPQDPLEMVQRVANITVIKMTEHLASGDAAELRHSMSMALRVADMMQKLGVGSKSAIEELEKVLSKADEDESSFSKPKTYEELEREFLERQKAGE